MSADDDPVSASLTRPGLSVALRTQGRRLDTLREALVCLAAQTTDDLEVLLLVHADAGPTAEVRALVGEFAPAFRERVRVLPVEGVGRTAPLNFALEVARGRMLAFLDDDDLVTAHWAETFLAGAAEAPGRVVRAVAVDVPVRRDPEAIGPYVVTGGPRRSYPATFDLIDHCYENRTPICAFAVPLDVVRAQGLRFDDELPVNEDWDLLMHLALIVGVHDTGEVTSVYHRWDDAEATQHAVPQEVWDRARARVHERLDQRWVLLPPGSVSRVVVLGEMAAREEYLRFLEEAHEERGGAIEHLEGVVRAQEERVREAERFVAEMRASTSWRVTRPLRALSAAARAWRCRRRLPR